MEVGPSPQLSIVIFRFIRNVDIGAEEDDDVDGAEIIFGKDDRSPPENENIDNVLGGKNISNNFLPLPVKKCSSAIFSQI